MKFEHVYVWLSDPVTTTTLERPTKLNAITLTILSELIEAAKQISESEARTVVLSGTGSSFSAVMDFAETIPATKRQVARIFKGDLSRDDAFGLAAALDDPAWLGRRDSYTEQFN
jgi:enoyl-CoA hydratase/carnithine racemase